MCITFHLKTLRRCEHEHGCGGYDEEEGKKTLHNFHISRFIIFVHVSKFSSQTTVQLTVQAEENENSAIRIETVTRNIPNREHEPADRQLYTNILKHFDKRDLRSRRFSAGKLMCNF